MASFVLRKIDDDLWNKAKRKAESEGVHIHQKLIDLIVAWVTSERKAS